MKASIGASYHAGSCCLTRVWLHHYETDVFILYSISYRSWRGEQ